MDVAKEFAAAQKRLDRHLERNCIIALARIEGITPTEYAARVDAERAAARALEPGPMEVLGRMYRRINDAFVEMAENFAKGWKAAGRSQ